MKQKNKVSDVEIIGGGRTLTKEDEKAISDFIQARKNKLTKKKSRLSKRNSSNKKATAK